MTTSDPIEHVRRINRTWIVRGDLPEHTASYLDELQQQDPALLREVCELAIAATRLASREQRDPKPDFYATLFSRATAGQVERFLKDHAWTRRRAAEIASQP